MPANALERFNQEARHTFCEVSTRKELDRITIFVCAFATRHLCQICSELSCTVSSLCNIRVRLHHITPAGKVLTYSLGQNCCCVFLLCSVHSSVLNRSGTLSRTVSNRTIECTNFLCGFQIEGLAEKCHRIQGAFRVSGFQIIQANMGYRITDTHQLGCPVAVALGQLAAEHIPPSAIDQSQAIRNIQTIQEIAIFTVYR